jgi:hypothetical protein
VGRIQEGTEKKGLLLLLLQTDTKEKKIKQLSPYLSFGLQSKGLHLLFTPLRSFLCKTRPLSPFPFGLQSKGSCALHTYTERSGESLASQTQREGEHGKKHEDQM